MAGPRARLLLPALLAGAAFLSGCQGGSAPPQAVRNVGENLSGEACRAEPRRGQVRADQPVLDILCANSGRPAGSFVQLGPQRGAPASGDARKAFFARALEGSPPMRALSARATCDAPEWISTPAEPEILVARCTLKDGGWPYVVAGLAAGDALAVGEGQPSAFPALAHAMRQGLPGAAARDVPALTPAERQALADRLQALFGAGTAITGDAGAYQDFVELARLYNSTNNHPAAETAYRRALDLQTAALGTGHPGLGTTLMMLASEISNQGRGEEADAFFRRAEPLIIKSPDPGEYPRYLSYLGMHAANQRQFDRALSIARDTIQRRRDLIEQQGGGIPAGLESGASSGASIFGGAVLLQAELAHTLMFASAMALRTGDLAGAESFALEARRIVDRTPGLPAWWQPQVIGQLGEVLAARGDFRNAERLLASAASLRLRVFGTGWPVAQGMMALGRAQADDGRYPAAIDNYRGALRLVLGEAQVRNLNFDQIQPFLTAAHEQARLEPKAADALHAEMFSAVQLMREGTMGRAVARTAQRVASEDPRIAELVRERNEATRRRDRLQIDLTGELGRSPQSRDEARVARLRGELAQQTQRVDALGDAIEKAVPGFTRLASPRPVEPETLMKALGPREAMAVYAVGPDGAFAFLVRASGVRAAKLNTDEAQLAEQVKALRGAFEIRNRNVAPFDAALSHRLYRTLVAPFEAELAGVDQLFIVANGALASLPFGILATAPPATAAAGDYSNVAWFAKRVAIANPPSVRAFLELRALAGRPSAPEPLLALANPDFGGSAAGGLGALAGTCRTEGAVPSALIRALAPLPETADEVRRVALTLRAGNDALLLGPNATAANLRARQLERYRVLYFATHGLLPGELRCQAQPGLAMSAPPTDVSDPAIDGLLEAGEIASLRLDADLVVLSACNTAASGERLGGESLSGLAEAFFFAGARNLLVTHWQVPSQQTVALTTGMFERLGGDLKKGIALALRDSQMALAANPATSHPFFWGAFVLQGDGAPAGLPLGGNPS